MPSPSISSGFNLQINPYVERIREHSHVLESLTNIWISFRGKTCLVDLGCGNGHFLENYLKGNPDFLGLGVERRYKRTFKTAEKLKDTPSKVIQLTVEEFLQESPKNFWDEVWMQFPDPWPKPRHEKNRMVTSKLFFGIHRILKMGGRFCFRSDHREYWEFLQMMNSRSKLFPIEKSFCGNLFNDYPETLYQLKFLKRHIPIYSLEFKK